MSRELARDTATFRFMETPEAAWDELHAANDALGWYIGRLRSRYGVPCRGVSMRSTRPSGPRLATGRVSGPQWA